MENRKCSPKRATIQIKDSWNTSLMRIPKKDYTSPRLEIHYCPGCRWTARAAWMAQELLTTFPKELGEVALLPAEAGVFRIFLENMGKSTEEDTDGLSKELLFDRKSEGRFPELKEIKQAIRDRIAPEKSLGHSEKS